MALNFKNIKKNTEQPQTLNKPPVIQTGFKLSATNGKTYDLDEIIKTKLRSNSEATLNLRVNSSEELRDKLVEMVTKKILDDYGISYGLYEDEYKTKISEVSNFSSLFDQYYNMYYDEYTGIINNDGYDGSISMDTALRKITLTKEDIRKYTLSDVAEHQKEFVLPNKYRPVVIWTDGTDDPGNVTPTESVLYKDELYAYMYDILQSKDDRIVLQKNPDTNELEINLNDVSRLSEFNSMENKLDNYYDTIQHLTEQMSDLEERLNNINGNTGNPNININTVDEIEIDNNGNLITDPNAVPSVKAVYNLVSSYMSHIGRYITQGNEPNEFTLVVSATTQINDDELSVSSLDRIYEDVNGDYILDLFGEASSSDVPTVEELFNMIDNEDGDVTMELSDNVLVTNDINETDYSMSVDESVELDTDNDGYILTI